MTTRARVGVIAIVALTALTSTFVYAARSERYAPVWNDVKSAYTLDDPFCGPVDALKGLGKARGVLARTDEIVKASRFVREDADGLFLYDTPFGQFWMPQADDLWSLAVVLAEQEAEMYGAAGGLGVRPGDVVVDAGAHVGLFTRTALAAGASKVITFEVTPQSNLALRKNLAKEIADGRVVVVEKGVWHEPGVLPLVIIPKCSACNSVSHPWMGSSMEVPLVTIDDTMAALKVEDVDFMKLDVENAEANALRGARRTLKLDQPRLAVALENSRTRIAYGHEVLGVIQEAFAGYEYSCGAVSDPEKLKVILPEVLHFYPD